MVSHLAIDTETQRSLRDSSVQRSQHKVPPPIQPLLRQRVWVGNAMERIAASLTLSPQQEGCGVLGLVGDGKESR